jgi:hypothetical protein
VDAVVHRDRSPEGALEGGRLGHVDVLPIDERVDGPAAGAGEEADVVTGLRELQGDGRADGPGSGDYVDGHLIS